jgi:hypothetical protein
VSLALFEALEGIRFVYRGRLVMSVVGGRYSNGRGAVQVLLDGGEPYAALSVNLPDHEIPDDAFFAKKGSDHADTEQIRAAVLGLGIFESTGEHVSAGYVEDYAAIWRFRSCTHGARVVLCAKCRQKIDDKTNSAIEKILAADAVKRLAGRWRPDPDADGDDTEGP